MRSVRIAIFASGNGSNAMALIRKARELSSQQVEISFVLSDREGAPVLEKAAREGVKTYLVPVSSTRTDQESKVLALLREHRVDWIFLAGYMRLLSPLFLDQVRRWHRGSSQVVNIHPSLLPAYPGVNSIARAYQDQVVESGVTLHLVDDGLDTGPQLRQEVIPVLATQQTLAQFEEKMHQLEHKMYTGFLADLALGSPETLPFKEDQ
ncbi:MAG: phosphoribosylglycinamide formyltransferase [Bdellovibrio sp.]